MKVIYYSKAMFADCDFPLIKALQDKGIDVRYYMPLPRGFQRKCLIELDKPARFSRFIKASRLRSFNKYYDCVDIDKLYLIFGYPTRHSWPFSWFVWIIAVLHMIMQHPDIIHIDWPLSSSFEKLLMAVHWKAKKIVTVHDPIAHTGNYCQEDEKRRIQLFKWADELILLNTKQTDEFCRIYEIPQSKINYSSLGVYDSIFKLKISDKYKIPEGRYILFFGYINRYKGLEYLLKSMKEVHGFCRDLKLIVAGGGDFYFDVDQFQNLSYVEWRHRYIGNEELSSLLRGCEFVVCPYTDATQSGVIQTAFSFSVPVVASSVGSISDSVVNGETGLLVPPCNIEALTSAIVELEGNYKLRDKMRRNIEEKWMPKMSWDSIAEQYLSVYVKSLS